MSFFGGEVNRLCCIRFVCTANGGPSQFAVACRLRGGSPFYVTASWSEQKERFSAPRENPGTSNRLLYFVWFGIGNRRRIVRNGGFCGTTGMRLCVENTDRKTVERFYALTNTCVPYGKIYRTVKILKTFEF